MGDAINFSALIDNLPNYIEQPSACYAVILPLVLGLFFNVTTSHRKWPELHAVTFVLGTTLSVVFSLHRTTGDEEVLLGLPGYALLLLLLPLRFSPSWQQAFVCNFASLLIADLWGAATPHLIHGSLPNDFYFGVGGAGFGDQLFLVPLLMAPVMVVRQWMSTRDWAERPLGAVLATTVRQLVRGSGR